MNIFDIKVNANSKRVNLYINEVPKTAEAVGMVGIITGISIEELFDMVNILLGGVAVGPPEGLRFEYDRDYEVRTEPYRMFWRVQRNVGEVFVYENSYGGDLIDTYLFTTAEFMRLAQAVIAIATEHCLVEDNK